MGAIAAAVISTTASRCARPVLAAVAATALLVLSTASSASAAPLARGDVIDDSYIVVYEKAAGSVSTETTSREGRLGFKSSRRFSRALEGFSATLTPRQVERLRADPEIDFVTQNRRVRATGSVPLAGGDSSPLGVRRMRAGTATTARQASGVNVAVIDTGIKLSHPDLNVVSGTNCVSPGAPADDDNGHGTHVAGTIAAENDGSGVVGVAPGTRTYAVKVLNAEGEGSTASVICGIDWVTANHAALNIDVANMSLGGTGPPVASCGATSDPEHAAICTSTAAGVNYVVAAGNDGWDFDYGPAPDTPAAYPEVLTVSALSDSDGAGGGLGPAPSCRPTEADDTPASFSNFALTQAGEAHTIAAPGVCIASTWNNGGYATISGTSMASPHVAGLLARCLDEAGISGPCATKTPAQVITYLQGQAQALSASDPNYGFAGDPNAPGANFYGYLIAPYPEADVPPNTMLSSGPSGTTSASAASFGFSSTAPGSTFECKLDGAAWEACTSPKAYSGLGGGMHTFRVRATDPEGDTDPTEATRVWTIAATTTATTSGGTATSSVTAPLPGPAKANLAGAKGTIRVRRGRFSYVFRGGAGLTGTSSFRSVRRIRVSTSWWRRVTIARKASTVPAGGKVTLTIKLSRKNLRILRRNRSIRLLVTVKLRNAAGLTSTATRRLTLKI